MWLEQRFFLDYLEINMYWISVSLLMKFCFIMQHCHDTVDVFRTMHEERWLRRVYLGDMQLWQS